MTTVCLSVCLLLWLLFLFIGLFVLWHITILLRQKRCIQTTNYYQPCKGPMPCAPQPDLFSAPPARNLSPTEGCRSHGTSHAEQELAPRDGMSQACQSKRLDVKLMSRYWALLGTQIKIMSTCNTARICLELSGGCSTNIVYQ